MTGNNATTTTAAQAAAPRRPHGDEDYRDVERLFVELAGTTDDQERSRRRGEIITRCLPLADRIAYRYRDRGQPPDDVTQVARLGLVNAVNRYQPDRGRFLAFAVPTILGEVRRYFRDCTWGMGVPRAVKDGRCRVRGAIDPLSQRLGRAPTASELAAELQMDREQVVLSLDAGQAYQPDSLSATIAGGADSQRTALDRLGLDDLGYSVVEDTMVVAGLVNQLSRRERAILRMRFCDCMTQTQIAQRMGMSQVHVSRLLSATLERLRTRLLEDAEPRTLRRVV